MAERAGQPHIGVLGPATVGGVPVRGRPARLLVGLVAADRPMSLDELAEVVWPEGPPPTFRPALHVHLGTLRKALGDGASIDRVGERYELRVDPVELDVEVAARRVGAARVVVADDPVAGRALVADALALWRGTPFAVDGDLIDAPASHQAEALRRDAEELLVEALLASNDAAAAESAALRFVADEPLREVRWGQLLRARYLAGRTADALATFQEARATLVEELGIEPGRDLSDLEAAALTDDRERLRLPRTSARSFLPPAPPSSSFVGRDVVLRRVCDRAARSRATLVLGAPGVGKTRLALEVARTAGDVAWLDARAPSFVDDVAQLEEWLRARPDALVVVDNADVAVDAVTSVVDRLRRQARSAAVVITSRVPLRVDSAVEILAPLDAHASAEAFRDALEELAPATTADQSLVDRICRRAGGLPLVLRLIAAAARALPIDALAERPATVEGGPIDEAVTSVLALVSDRAREAFADLSVVDAFDVRLAAALAALQPSATERVLVELVDHGLVVARTDLEPPYAMLEPIREVAARHLDRAGRRTEVLDRQADVCIAVVRELDVLAAADAEGLEADIGAELARVRTVLDHLTSSGDAERALELVCRLERSLYTLGWWSEKVELLDRALAIPGPPTAMRARAHAFRARPGPLHLFDLGHAERAEAIAVELGSDLLVAFTRHIRAIGLWWRGEHARSIELSSDAAERFAAANRLVEWSEARKYLAVALVAHGDVDEGLTIADDALAVVRREIATPFHVAHHLAFLGHCHRLLGDDGAALADWSEAQERLCEVGNRGTAIHVEIGLADLAVDRGDPSAALQLTANALEMIRASGGWTYLPWTWTVAMRAHAVAGELGAAITCARRALADLSRVPSGETVRLAFDLAGVALQVGDAPAASRLVAVGRTTPDVREMPFAPATERARFDRIAAAAGAATDSRPRSISEAAGPLLLPR